MGPGALESNVTPDLLKESGYTHLLDWPFDDQPIWMHTRAGPLLSVPYPMELNDAGTLALRDHTGREFADMIVDQFEEMLEQSERHPLVFSLALHGFIVGQPFRLRPLRQAIRHCVEHKARDRVWYTRAGDVAKYCFSMPKGLPAIEALSGSAEFEPSWRSCYGQCRASGNQAMNFVDLDRVSLRYGEDGDGTLALQGATLGVGAGEFVAVVGPSGCGKSTLMKVVTGLWPATTGIVMVSGRKVAGPLSIVGMAFQNPTLLPWRKTLDNVMLPLEIVQPHCWRLRSERAAYVAKARDLLALVGLRGFEDRFPWELSGGMQQRASLCRALIHDPSLLMLDEPFAALDMFTREELWLALQSLWLARRPTVILVTHDLREAVFLADRVLVMSARPGRIVAERAINLVRPRRLDATYEPYSVAMVHELREHISAARSSNS